MKAPIMGELYYDGITADPLEVLFVKYKDAFQTYSWAKIAAKFDSWDHQASLAGNEYKSLKRKVFIDQVFGMVSKGIECFDLPHYQRQVRVSSITLWQHFLLNGLRGGQKFRFICDQSDQLFDKIKSFYSMRYA
jgi:hypothetical protein